MEPITTPPVETPAEARRALLFATLSILWVFPSLGAAWIVVRAEPASAGVQAFSDRPVEYWISWLILVLHPMFVWLGWSGFRKFVSR